MLNLMIFNLRLPFKKWSYFTSGAITYKWLPQHFHGRIEVRTSLMECGCILLVPVVTHLADIHSWFKWIRIFDCFAKNKENMGFILKLEIIWTSQIRKIHYSILILPFNKNKKIFMAIAMATNVNTNSYLDEISSGKMYLSIML